MISEQARIKIEEYRLSYKPPLSIEDTLIVSWIVGYQFAKSEAAAEIKTLEAIIQKLEDGCKCK